MAFRPLPTAASWEHRDARSGFEVAFFAAGADGGWVIEGSTAALEAGDAWVVTYRIEIDAGWRTRRALIGSRSVGGARETRLESDGAGHWLVDGVAAPGLDGCLDVDLESSAMTNTMPVHRLDLGFGAAEGAPAAYVRAVDLGVGRLEQTYRRVGAGLYEYAAPAFDFAARLTYDESGLVTDYPGIARRVS
jgi:uncharacterized protein